MPTTTTRPYIEALQSHIDEFVVETGNDEFSTAELAEWAILTDRWEPPSDLVTKKCRQDYSRALREQYIKDAEGQPVRQRHVLRSKEQTYIWADIRRAKRSHIETSFRQRREQIVGECRQLDRDRRYWNKNNETELPIQLVFDFTDDVQEGLFSGEYPPKQPR